MATLAAYRSEFAMIEPTSRSCAVNAAGIADQFRFRQLADEDGDNRLRDITDFANGWLGVADKLGEAGELMERIRLEHGPGANWGSTLPHVYDVWHAVSLILWHNFESPDLDRLIRLAVAHAAIGHLEDD